MASMKVISLKNLAHHFIFNPTFEIILIVIQIESWLAIKQRKNGGISKDENWSR